MPSLSDAIAVTSAASGTVLATQTIYVGNLTAPQRTALLSFVTSLGLPMPSANIVSLLVNRQAGAPTLITASVTGISVPGSAAAALTNRTTYDDIIGIVP